MRKKRLSRNVGVLLDEETYQSLVSCTNHLENTMSEYIRSLVKENLKDQRQEDLRNE
jgi:hypothetical protein